MLGRALIILAVSSALLFFVLGFGCAPREDDPYRQVLERREFRIDGPVADALKASLRHWDRVEPAPDAGEAFHRARAIRRAVINNAHGETEREFLLRRWWEDPTNLIWLDAAEHWRSRVGGFPALDSLFALPALADTTTAAGRLAWARAHGDDAAGPRMLARAEVQAEAIPADQRRYLRSQIAFALIGLGEHERAIAMMLRELDPPGGEGGVSLEAMLWDVLGDALFAAGRSVEALHALHRSTQLFERGGCPARALANRVYFAEILYSLGDAATAIDLALSSAAAAERADLPEARLMALNRIASFYSERGEHRTDLFIAHETRDIAVQLESKNLPLLHLNVADAYLNLGLLDSCAVALAEAKAAARARPSPLADWAVTVDEAIYRAVNGQYAIADSLFARAEATRPPFIDADFRANQLLGLARHAREAGRPEVARRAMADLAALIERESVVSVAMDAEFELALEGALLRVQTGEFGGSRRQLKQAAARLAELPAPKREARYWDAAASLAESTGDVDSVLVFLRRGLRRAEASHEPKLIDDLGLRLAGTLVRREALDEARAVLDRVGRDLHVSPTSRTLQRRSHLRGRILAAEGKHRQAIALLDEVIAGAGANLARDLAVGLRVDLAGSLLARNRRADAGRRIDEAVAIITAAQAADRQRDHLRRSHRQALRDLHALQLRLLLDGRERGGGELALRALESRQRYSDLALGSQTMRAPRLPRRALTAAYFVEAELGYVMIIDGGELEVVTVAGAAAHEEAMATLRRFTREKGRPLPAGQAAEIADWLLAPLGARWRPGEPLHLLLDGPLHGLPLAALPWGEARVLDHAPVVELASLAGSADPVLADGCGGRLLAIGYDGPDGDGRLSMAEAEARAVSRLWAGETAVFVGADATRERLTEPAAALAAAIHLSTHGEITDDDAGGGRLRFAPDAAGRDDLDLAEIAALELGAELVFLSSCESMTADRAGGDPTTGFAHAFLRGSAESVIAAAVKIADRSAHDFAIAFYASLCDGGGVTDSFWLAQRSLAADPEWAGEHYWANYHLLLAD